VGAALGLAILATLSASHAESLSASGHSTAAALTGGYHFAFWIAAALVLATIVVALTVLKQPRQPAAKPQMATAEVAGCEAA
jgi:tellurite resistance protein TehA-like permease